MASNASVVSNKRRRSCSGVYCIAPGCTNGFYKNRDVHFHRLPLNNKKLLKSWVISMKRSHPPLNVSARVCSEHFRDEDYLLKMKFDESGRLILYKTAELNPGAVPTRFDFSSYATGTTDRPSTSTQITVTERQARAAKQTLSAAERQSPMWVGDLCLGGQISIKRQQPDGEPTTPSTSEDVVVPPENNKGTPANKKGQRKILAQDVTQVQTEDQDQQQRRSRTNRKGSKQKTLESQRKETLDKEVLRPVACDGPSSKRKRTSLTLETKLEIIKRVEAGESGSAIGRCYNLGESTIRNIKNNAKKIKSSVVQSSCTSEIATKVRHPLEPTHLLLSVQPNTCTHKHNNDVDVSSKEWQVFGIPIKEENLDSDGFNEELQGKIKEIDEIVKEEEIYCHEGLSCEKPDQGLKVKEEEKPDQGLKVKEEDLDDYVLVKAEIQDSDESNMEDIEVGDIYVTVGIHDV